jgi:hypothetical protein
VEVEAFLETGGESSTSEEDNSDDNNSVKGHLPFYLLDASYL